MVADRKMTGDQGWLSKKIIAPITWISIWIGIVAMVVIVLIVFLDVCGRYY